MDFQLKTQFKPRGDQGKAIKQLTKGIETGEQHQVLHGVTGSGKTFTMANVIEHINRPTLVISHNKMLAWQLYQEFKDFFPENAVNYFVSYYDYYQPEAYLPQTDTYISKDASVNKKIDKLRHSAVQDVLTRPDTIIVASVSCIYNLGSPETFQQVSMDIKEGQEFKRKELLAALVGLGYSRNDFAPEAGQFRAKGNRIEIYPATGENPITLELEKDEIKNILVKNGDKNALKIWPANFWITPENKLKIAMNNIRAELHEQLTEIKKENTPEAQVRAYRLEQKTNYDLELIEQMGYCPGIENYSRHIDFREANEAPFTLMDYFGKNYLTVIDESHMTIPQIRGMYAGDRARKKTLIEHGFRLPSAIDNRPLNFEEFEQRVGQSVYMSATPGNYELEKSGHENVAEQIVRPTGLLDPVVEVRPTKDQMNSAMKEIEKTIEKDQRVLVVTLTKRLAEDIAEYMEEEGIKTNYIHSDVHTLERPLYMKKLREGKYDVLVGINLLREGLDFPEVSLVIIFDADKEGFLRNETTLLQTIGRAARHVEGKAILYADKMTDSIKKTLKETKRRRKIQMKYNEKHGIKPETIKKKIAEMPEELFATDEDEDSDMAPYKKMAKTELEREMKKAAKELDFEKAAKLRDEIKKLKE